MPILFTPQASLVISENHPVYVEEDITEGQWLSLGQWVVRWLGLVCPPNCALLLLCLGINRSYTNKWVKTFFCISPCASMERGLCQEIYKRGEDPLGFSPDCLMRGLRDSCASLLPGESDIVGVGSPTLRMLESHPEEVGAKSWRQL